MQHESGCLGQSGDHGIQLTHIILHLLAMACSMNQVIYDRVGTMVFSCIIILCICCDGMQHESGNLEQSGDHGIQLQQNTLHLYAMACSMNQVI